MLRHLLFAALFYLVGGMGYAADSKLETANELYARSENMALSLEERRQARREAIEILSEAIGQGIPDTEAKVRALVQRGTLYLRGLDCPKAVSDMTAAIDNGASTHAPYLLRGQCVHMQEPANIIYREDDCFYAVDFGCSRGPCCRHHSICRLGARRFSDEPQQVFRLFVDIGIGSAPWRLQYPARVDNQFA